MKKLLIALIATFTIAFQSNAQTVTAETGGFNNAKYGFDYVQFGGQYDVGAVNLTTGAGIFSPYVNDYQFGLSAGVEYPVGNLFVGVAGRMLSNNIPNTNFAAEGRIGISLDGFDVFSSYVNRSGNWYMRPISVRVNIR